MAWNTLTKAAAGLGYRLTDLKRVLKERGLMELLQVSRNIDSGRWNCIDAATDRAINSRVAKHVRKTSGMSRRFLWDVERLRGLLPAPGPGDAPRVLSPALNFLKRPTKHETYNAAMLPHGLSTWYDKFECEWVVEEFGQEVGTFKSWMGKLLALPDGKPSAMVDTVDTVNDVIATFKAETK